MLGQAYSLLGFRVVDELEDIVDILGERGARDLRRLLGKLLASGG